MAEMSLKRVLAERGRSRRSRQEQARTEAWKLAAELRQRFVFHRLYLIGSLAKGRFGSQSDIDLVIQGLAPESFFKGYAFLLKESRFPIDLKPFEDLPPEEQSRIVQEGKSLG